MHPVGRQPKDGRRPLAAALLVLALVTAGATAMAGTITGRAPAAGTLLLYNDNGPPPVVDGYLRVPDRTVAVAGGPFQVEVTPGRYYLGLFHPADPDHPHPPPPRDGDTLCRWQTPDGRAALTIAGDQPTPVGGAPACRQVHRPDLDTMLAMVSDPARVDTTVPPNAITGDTGISGTVRDEAGEPLAGVLVFAVDDQRGVRFVSLGPTDTLGRYLVLTDRADGTYRVEAALPTANGGGIPPATVAVAGGEVVQGVDLPPQPSAP